MRKPADQLEKRLAYAFDDPLLLEQALTHRSAAPKHNERLEFLGDAILGFVVAGELFERFPDVTEGQLSRLRSALVKKEVLAETARALDLGAYLRLGAGELRTGGHARSSILADALEAIFAAVYLDANAAEARRVILLLIGERIEGMTLESGRKDSKTLLQELLQERKLGLPVYELTGVEGEVHAQRFYCRCLVSELAVEGTGEGKSRRKAEQAAAADVLKRIRDDA